MYILITYDINVTKMEGQKRLRKVAKICTSYGQRVQNSVFECKISEEDFLLFKNKLFSVVNLEIDSLRFYRLGKNYDKKVKHYGAKRTYKFEDPIII